MLFSCQHAVSRALGPAEPAASLPMPIAASPFGEGSLLSHYLSALASCVVTCSSAATSPGVCSCCKRLSCCTAPGASAAPRRLRCSSQRVEEARRPLLFPRTYQLPPGEHWTSWVLDSPDCWAVEFVTDPLTDPSSRWRGDTGSR